MPPIVLLRAMWRKCLRRSHVRGKHVYLMKLNLFWLDSRHEQFSRMQHG